jgi:Fic family protein
MVYHEIRKVNGKKQNYIIYNERKDGKWIKKSKFIGYGNLKKEFVNKMKDELKIEVEADRSILTKKQILEIEVLKKAYNEKIKTLDKEEFQAFQKSFITELTYNSNAIEGSSLSLEDTKLILNENIVPEGKSLREIYEAKNHAEALRFINNCKTDLDELFILKLHKIILNNISERFAGRYRETNVRIFGSDVKFPESIIVPQLVKNLVYWYNKNKRKMHPFELAVIFSMKLVSIHPFVDGNGRVSRLTMNFLLCRKDYPWINVYMKQRAEYLKAVREANDEDYSSILEFLIKTLKDNLKSFNLI